MPRAAPITVAAVVALAAVTAAGLVRAAGGAADGAPVEHALKRVLFWPSPTTGDGGNGGGGDPPRCLDGSPAGYYIDAPPDGKPAPTKWIVWLEGGGICQSAADCRERAKSDLGSSVNWPAQLAPDANHDLLSADPMRNPDFAQGWRHVFVPYCSGDAWVGDATEALSPFDDALGGEGADGDAFVGYFQGRTILMRTLEVLGLVGVGPDAGSGAGAALAPAVSEFVLTGCSAGGIGTFLNADAVSERIVAAFPSARVVARPEAGWFGLPLLTYDAFTHGAPDPDMHHMGTSEWTKKIATWPWQTTAYAQCVADRRHHLRPKDNCTDHEACCTFAPYLYPYISTPMFVSQSVADSYQIFTQGGAPLEDSEPVHKYVEYLRATLHESLERVVVHGNGLRLPSARAWRGAPAHKLAADGRAGGGGNGIFGVACMGHCLPWRSNASTVRGYDDAGAFGAWYRGALAGGAAMLLDDTTKLAPTC
mmetsp:Transcript_9087/g.37199  ORF Transcript_9087/g.37199 Transcript_9087/m.37199 type:complete len:479 (-) Transcript_9087:48-1484(-)